ncbi:HD domain-containing phosphohydrolase [Butyrivibrio sp. CB08]|uniref:HD domain-containing phosphohydrolase n=1 Tax=Butyrivibrio sp. CB08 TaxID=2364879 RepID=UPI0013144449|nr:HD domain-containing phosphohydrolase [Butyrivibrio sp. CB08]
MKERKTWQIILFIAMCVSLNIVGKLFATWLELPLWLDSFGTALAAFYGGPVVGALVGATGNLAYCVVNRLSAAYSLTSIILGVIIGIAAHQKWFDRFYGFMKTASYAMLGSLIVSVPINFIFDNGYTGNKWGNGVIEYLLERDWPPFVCKVLGQLSLEFADKLLTVFVAYVLIRLRRWNHNENEEKKKLQGTTAHTAVALCIVLGMSMLAPLNVQAASGSKTGTSDYNDYVQSIYSSNNGLPCGEANDIAQTNDGVLWIGTYAGLYRYNGREFRWVDEYESVKNVNCLYVDEEGRLWIGTNDNGLSIVIREKLVNVIDQSSGLPSNSVRSIVRATDGYYYIGTSSSMQVLMMNNGLKPANTLTEVNYAESITSDKYAHVVAVSSDGTLFLMKGGAVIASLKLPGDAEVFKSCCFAPDGKLKVGSSTNHIYTYDVFGDKFNYVSMLTCDGVASINNLNFLEDGTMFISTDSGVSYVDDNGYHRINTNDFDNSIDHMLCDYQGNLWFTSSRLGLLRLAKSPFKDIYGSIGMERQVVNAIVAWQGCYYIGTDAGLDVVDKACHDQIHNTLTSELQGKRIRCMYVDDQDHLWVCTYGSGLWEYSKSGESWEYSAEKGSFGNRARIVTQLSDGTMMAAGDTGISFIKNHQVTRTIGHEDGLINSMILTVTERSDGTILAGTDGDGIAVLRDGKVEKMITRDDGLSSGVILRTIKDPKTDGVFVVTSNSLCYLDTDGSIRVLDKFPYFNNYDIWVKDEDTLFVMSSAGIYVVERDELVEGGQIAWELLDARRGLGTSLTANSWNYYNDNGELLLPCDTGVYKIDVEKYNSDVRSYRMQLASVNLDGVPQPIDNRGTITVRQGVNRVELGPEILNYTIQEPNVGYLLDGYDTQWTIVPQNSLNSINYVNLPAGNYTFRLAIFDSSGERVLEERKFPMVKEGEFHEQPFFTFYILLILSMIMIWFTWLIVQRQLNQQQIKINMANETVMAIANAVDAKDLRTHQHSLRVAEYSVLIAEEMNCFKWWQKNRMLSNLRKAAQMHDIGKIAVPDSVLNKVGRLTDDEYAKMKSHVIRGAEILKDFTLVEHVEEGTRYHHERYDGKGYPDGLKGEEIPLFGRIIGVADAFDAMTSNRVYRNHMDTGYVMNEMLRGRGTQFDPDALDAFFRLLDKKVINLDEIYAQKRAEIDQADQEQSEELKRRVEEDRKIQEAEMKAESAKPAEEPKAESAKPDEPKKEEGGTEA